MQQPLPSWNEPHEQHWSEPIYLTVFDPVEEFIKGTAALTSWGGSADRWATVFPQESLVLANIDAVLSRNIGWFERRSWRQKRIVSVQRLVAAQEGYEQARQWSLHTASTLLGLTNTRGTGLGVNFYAPDVLPAAVSNFLLPSDESPHADVFVGRMLPKNGAIQSGSLLITNKRAIFASSSGVEEWPLASIMRVTWAMQWPERPNITITARNGMHTLFMQDALRVADLLQVLISMQHNHIMPFRALPPTAATVHAGQPQVSAYQPFPQIASLFGLPEGTLVLGVLDPLVFEQLVADLFTRMGLETHLTKASHDGGIDCIAYDRRPIIGGEIIIQAKRYSHTVGVGVVRDLYGALQDRRASKAIVVTNNTFGPDSYRFVADKPMELIDGAKLVSLLQEHMDIRAVTGV